MSTILLPIVTEVCDRLEACALWHDALVGLEDLEQHFGPGITRELPDEERYYRVLIGDHVIIGLGWSRRFAASGYVRWFGMALLPTARGQGLSVESGRAIVTAIFQDFPETCTVLAMIHDTNPRAQWRPNRHGRMRYIGTIESTTPACGAIHLLQLTREAWRSP